MHRETYTGAPNEPELSTSKANTPKATARNVVINTQECERHVLCQAQASVRQKIERTVTFQWYLIGIKQRHPFKAPTHNHPKSHSINNAPATYKAVV